MPAGDRGADEVAESVDRADRRLVEPAGVEGAGQVRGMVLDRAGAGGHVPRGQPERGSSAALKIALPRRVSPVGAKERAAWAVRQGEPCLLPEVRTWKTRHREDVDLVGRAPAIRRQASIASVGTPAQCLIRRNRSSSTAATSVPSRSNAAETSP
jgi:hypothetical protein